MMSKLGLILTKRRLALSSSHFEQIIFLSGRV
jgi:hypothetical protein